MPSRFFYLAAVLLLAGCYTIQPKSPDVLRAGLEPTIKVAKPDGDGPFPTVILFNGAGEPSWRQGYGDWMDWLKARGYAAVFADSAAARKVSPKKMMGPGLMPSERAADVYVLMDILRSRPYVDASRFAVIGMSHGGDTVLDALVQAPPAGPLTGITEMPPLGLDGLKAVVAFYPACHKPIMGVRITENYDRTWSQQIPVAIFQGGDDSFVDEPLCQALVERQKAQGTPIAYNFYEGVPHCFDADYGNDPNCRLVPEPAADAHAKVEQIFAAAFE
jgi:dienelactone hydrolase